MKEGREAIEQALRDVGIPKMAMGSTLPLRGYADLRDRIRQRSYVKTGDDGSYYEGFAVHATSLESYPLARQVFFLLAKEMSLSGERVVCTDLLEIVRLLEDAEVDLKKYDALRDADMVFIMPFYEGSPVDNPVCTRLHNYLFTKWMREVFDSGKGVSVFTGTTPLPKTSSWWSQELLHLAAKRTAIIKI